jgi:2-polyprenyl-6-methoxyphenol hydroxylase-like FAD-dependent oxidoreductase
MKFVVAGGGVAGLASALAVARAGHEAVVLERDPVPVDGGPLDAVREPRRGIPHFLQPHAFLPRGLRELQALAPDVVDALRDAGADEQDLRHRLHGPPMPGDEELVYLWVRRPLIEWALRRAAAAEPGVELRAAVQVSGLVTDDGGRTARGVRLGDGAVVGGDVVVDALGRYRPPADWPRVAAKSHDSGVLYYTRYFELAPGVEHLDGPLLGPRGDLGYMGFNTFRGDNRTYSVIMLTPAADRDLRVLRDEAAWMRACSLIRPLDVMTALDYARPITPVMPMGGLQNIDRTDDLGIAALVAVGDAFCHTDPAFSYGLAFSLAHARALAAAAQDGREDVAERYLAAVREEALERYELANAIGDTRAARWAGESLDIGRRDGCYPLFAFAAAFAAAPHDDLVLRRTIGRIGLLDRTAVLDADNEAQSRIETIFARLMQTPPPPPGPPRDELLACLACSPSFSS